MGLGVLPRADQALLLAGEQDEADRAPGFEPRLRDDARRLERSHRAGAVVARARGEVP